MKYIYKVQTGVIQEDTKKLKLLMMTVASTLMILSLTLPTFAAGNGKNGPTVGDCMSDILYGNEPNMANGAPGGPAEQTPGTKGGNVLPTQSPGPFVNNPTDPENPTRGRSAGQLMQDGINVPELCRIYAQ